MNRDQDEKEYQIELQNELQERRYHQHKVTIANISVCKLPHTDVRQSYLMQRNKFTSALFHLIKF